MSSFDIRDITVKNWKTYSNMEFDTWNEYSIYRKKIDSDKKHLLNEEEKWVNTYLMPIIDFMGDSTYWDWYKTLDYCDEILNGKIRRPPRDNNNSKKFCAYFTGTHWYSKKPGQKLFNSYDEYQYPGSNQFCQTFALMNLVDELPPVIEDKDLSFKKYYMYTYAALMFIKKFVDKLKKTELYTEKHKEIKEHIKYIEVCLKELFRYPNMALNCVELSKNN